MKFHRNLDRDVILLRAHLAGGIHAVRAAAMLMPDMAGGPDVFDAYGRWMSSPQRKAYRRQVAAVLKAQP